MSNGKKQGILSLFIQIYFKCFFGPLLSQQPDFIYLMCFTKIAESHPKYCLLFLFVDLSQIFTFQTNIFDVNDNNYNEAFCMTLYNLCILVLEY
jgi:hypothetical protein